MATSSDGQPGPSPQLASPYSTGGGGVDFESSVGAIYLAMLLIGAIPRGQSSGVTTQVRFQQKYADEHVDDLVIRSELPASQAKLSIQVKRDLSIGPENEVF